MLSLHIIFIPNTREDRIGKLEITAFRRLKITENAIVRKNRHNAT